MYFGTTSSIKIEILACPLPFLTFTTYPDFQHARMFILKSVKRFYQEISMIFLIRWERGELERTGDGKEISRSMSLRTKKDAIKVKILASSPAKEQARARREEIMRRKEGI